VFSRSRTTGRRSSFTPDRDCVARIQIKQIAFSLVDAGSKCFDTAEPSQYTGKMNVRLSPELQAKLDRLAAEQGRDADSLVSEAVERLVDYDEWFLQEVEKGLAQIDRGEVLENSEVGARLEELLAAKQRRG
jgi:predicted transcriptional regulator